MKRLSQPLTQCQTPDDRSAHCFWHSFPPFCLCCCPFIHSIAPLSMSCRNTPTKPLMFLAARPVGSVLLSQSCLGLVSCSLVIAPSTVRNLPLTPQQPSLSLPLPFSLSFSWEPIQYVPHQLTPHHVLVCVSHSGHICSPKSRYVCLSLYSSFFSFAGWEAGASKAISMPKLKSSAPASLQKHACAATLVQYFTPHLKRDAFDSHVSWYQQKFTALLSISYHYPKNCEEKQK